MGKPLQLLLVEDSKDDTDLLLRELRRGGYEVLCERVETAEAMRAALDERTWEVVVADYFLPNFSGLEALNILHLSGQDLPFIIVSGAIGEDIAVGAMKAGAHDYLMKGKLARLVPAIERELREAAERRERRHATEQLRKLSRAVEQSPAAVVITDPTGRIEYVNPKFTTLTGYTSAEASGQNPRLLKSGHTPPELYQQLWNTIAAGNDWNGELLNRKKNGELYWQSISISSLTDAVGSITHYVAVIEDVTARKHTEAQLQYQLQRLAALRAIDMAITTSFDLRVTLHLLIEQGVPQLRAEAADVFLLNPHSQVLEFASSRGFRGSGVSRSRQRLGEGLAGHAALERRNVYIPNLADSPLQDIGERLSGEGFVTYNAFPLVIKGNIKGVLEIYHRAPFEPDPDWINFAETLAEQAAIAIDNTTLFEDLQRSNIELALAYDVTLEGWSRALDLRDRETEGHTQRVTDLTVRLARLMGISESELVHIRRGALLHDIGKMGIPDSILLKPGPLTDEEFKIMRLHAGYAYELLAPIAYLRPALDIPYCHHEKWDGTGYPRELKGEQIPLAARIFAVVDVWDALNSNRPYRAAWPKDKVQTHIRSEVGRHFDPYVVDEFVKLAL